VASSNVGPDHRSLDQMASDVLALDADVLNILELTEADRSALHAAGITERYPHFVEDARAGAHGSGIYSRYPLRDTGCWRSAEPRWPMRPSTCRLDRRP
jgi:hypothetical protein